MVVDKHDTTAEYDNENLITDKQVCETEDAAHVPAHATVFWLVCKAAEGDNGC